MDEYTGWWGSGTGYGSDISWVIAATGGGADHDSYEGLGCGEEDGAFNGDGYGGGDFTVGGTGWGYRGLKSFREG